MRFPPMKSVGKYIAAVLLSLPTAVAFSMIVDTFVEETRPGEYDARIAFFALFASWVALTLWISRAATGRYTISRGCGAFSLAAFAIPVGAIVTVILAPPAPDPIFPPFLYVFFFATIGVPLGLIAWGLARAFGRHEPR